jgi:hypothetical protein
MKLNTSYVNNIYVLVTISRMHAMFCVLLVTLAVKY